MSSDILKTKLCHKLRDISVHITLNLFQSILGNILAPYVIKFMPLNFAKFLVDYGIYRFLYKHYFKYSEIMLQDVVNGITNNPELKAVLMYLAGDYGNLML